MARPEYPSGVYSLIVRGSSGDLPVFDLSPEEQAFARGMYDRRFPAIVVPPPPPAPPPLPPLTMKVAAESLPQRGHGINLSDPKYRDGDQVVLRDHWVEGHDQNIVGMGLTVPFLIERAYALRAWRDNPSDRYQGQGFFFQNCPKGGTLRECVAAWNGWQPGRAASRRSGFLHGFYSYWDVGPVNIEWSIFAHNPCAGVQFKNCGNISDCLFFDCGASILSVRGPTKVRRALIVDGHRYAVIDGAGNVTSWTGDTGISTYGPLDVDDTYAYGGPLQRQPDVQPVAGRSYDLHAYEGSAEYNARPKVSDGSNPEWGVPKGKPDPGAPQGARWTVGPKVVASNWIGGAAGGSVTPTGIVEGPPLPEPAYRRIEQLVQEAISPNRTRTAKGIIVEAFEAAGLRF